jgi:hypothetical protein
LKYLDNKSGSNITIEDITNYLKKQDYEELSKKELRGKLDNLIDLGYVRAKTEGKGDKREEIFYLSEYLGSGLRKKRNLQGRGIFNDTSRLIKRLLGSFFFLIGIGLFLYEMPGLTGAVIGPSTSGFLVSVLFVFVGVATFFINSKKKKR